MKRQDLTSKAACKFKGIAYSKHKMPVATNLLGHTCVEYFFHSMRVGVIKYDLNIAQGDVRQEIFEYIEVDYNRRRRHSALRYLYLVNFEQQNVA